MSEDSDRLVPLAACPSEVQAEVILTVLKDIGIQAVCEGAHTANFRAENFGDVKVMVWEHELDLAREALDKYKASVQSIDWDQVDLSGGAEPGGEVIRPD